MSGIHVDFGFRTFSLGMIWVPEGPDAPILVKLEVRRRPGFSPTVLHLSENSRHGDVGLYSPPGQV